MKRLFSLFTVWGGLFWLTACHTPVPTPVAAQSTEPEQQDMPLTAPARVPVYMTYSYEIVNAYPHDTAAFTQGLVFYQGGLFESTGMYGSSSLRKVELETGRVLKKVDVPSQYFAEGLVLFHGRLLQLTWQNQIGFIYDQETFQQLGSFNYLSEGWGLTHDGKSLILSDGTNQIRFLDPNTFQVQRVINVLDRGQPVVRLNELEYVNGELLANVWLTNRLARINLNDGTVTSWIDLTGLLSPQESVRADVLNGIAYDETGDRLFVTGKYWPKLFEIRLKSARNEVRR
jgi:glutaminyl-peptide cyclotransferase